MNKKQFLTLVLPWLLVVLLTSTLIITSFHPKPTPIVLPQDNRIDSLGLIIDSLNLSYNKLKQDYDSAQSNIKTEIKYIQTKNAKDISNIRNYTTIQCDSMWSTITLP
jgi:hypothetical protein